MLKPTLAFAALLSVTIPSYSYIIGQTLSIENNTNTTLELSMETSGGAVSLVPPGKSSYYFENEDYSGLLQQTATVPFVIKNPDTAAEYVHGRVAFYVGNFAMRYSFLDSVTAVDTLNLKVNFSCKADGAAGDDVFENKIIISGNPGDNSLPKPVYKESVQCKGLLESSLENGQYTATCMDARNTIFRRSSTSDKCIYQIIFEQLQPSEGCFWRGEDNSSLLTNPDVVRRQGIKVALDKAAEKNFCFGW